MTKKERNIFLLITAGLILLPMAAGTGVNYIAILEKFLIEHEGFLPKPVWDVKQWSWGYGSRVPGSVNDPNLYPGGTITKQQAAKEAAKFYVSHYKYLSPLIKRNLNANQWAALLSFSYNTGTGNADNLVPNINSGNNTALKSQWMKYVYAGGEKLPGLVARRKRELDLFFS